MSADDVLAFLKDGQEKTVVHLQKDFRMVRTGRATPALVENLRVMAYGSEMPVKQCGTISVPEARQLVIKPFDPGILKEMEKALLASDLGVTPQNDGKMIRLTFPPLTEERRKKLAQEIKDKGEAAKVALRNTRRDANKMVDGLLDKKMLPEDDAKKLKDKIQEQVKAGEKTIDGEVEKKTKEVMEI